MKSREQRRELEGNVVSDRMDKTVVVVVQRLVKHPLYHKYIRKKAHYKAHDAKNECRIGDRVLIVETRPLSRDKRWRIKKILERIH
jgi:small subunit ribosomal protein S17